MSHTDSFALSFYERALRLPTFFSISGLAKHGTKPRLCISSWRAFTSTHPLMVPSTSPKKALLACPPFPPWNLLFFTVESTLSFPCSRSDPLFLAKVRLSLMLTLSHLRSGTLDRQLCSFSSWQKRLWHTCQLLSLWH